MKLASVVATIPLAGLALTSTVPARVDAVFPRNNSIYPPLYPFPLVFAIHNFDKVWQYQPFIIWSLDVLSDNAEPRMVDNGEIAWGAQLIAENWAPYPSMSLAINYTKNLDVVVFKYPSRLSLHIDYNIRKLNCNTERLDTQDIFFNITNITTSGIMPTVDSLRGCPLPVSNFDIGTPPESNWTCSHTSAAETPKLPCLFSADQHTFDQVASKMVEASGCLGASWPGGRNSTISRGFPCTSGVPVTPSAGSQMRRSSAAIALVFLSMGLAFVTTR